MGRGTTKTTLSAAVAFLIAVGSAAYVGGAGASTVTPGPGIKGHMVTIGFDSIMSGPSANFNDMADGATAYLKNVNAHGGIKGYKFNFKSLDSQQTASLAVANAKTLSTSSAIIAVMATTPVQGVATVANELKTPIFGFGSGDLFIPPNKYMFGENVPYSLLGLADARFVIQTLGIKDIAFAYQNDAVGTPTSALISSYVQSLGGTLLASVPIPVGSTNYTAFAQQLAQTGAKAVVTIMGPPLVMGLQKAAVSLGYSPKWTAFWSIETPSYVAAVPASVVANTYADGFQYPVSGSAAADNFATVIGKYYPQEVNSSLTVQGWDFGVTVQNAVRIALTHTKILTRKGILSAFTTGFKGQGEGFLPSITWNSKEHYGSTTSAMFTLQPDGTISKRVQAFIPLPTP